MSHHSSNLTLTGKTLIVTFQYLQDEYYHRYLILFFVTGTYWGTSKAHYNFLLHLNRENKFKLLKYYLILFIYTGGNFAYILFGFLKPLCYSLGNFACPFFWDCQSLSEKHMKYIIDSSALRCL